MALKSFNEFLQAIDEQMEKLIDPNSEADEHAMISLSKFYESSRLETRTDLGIGQPPTRKSVLSEKEERELERVDAAYAVRVNYKKVQNARQEGDIDEAIRCAYLMAQWAAEALIHIPVPQLNRLGLSERLGVHRSTSKGGRKGGRAFRKRPHKWTDSWLRDEFKRLSELNGSDKEVYRILADRAGTIHSKKTGSPSTVSPVTVSKWVREATRK